MKKYLMTGIAAIAMCAAFTSCSKDVDFEQAAQDRVQSKYDQAFLNYIGGPIDPNQDWGFSATRGITRSNPGDTYPSTEAYHNMNHNEWADPDKEFGGYTVPDPLTENQKKVVAAYFQTVSPLSYEDPHLRHFFVQQVYKGGKTTVRNTTEGIIAADNSAYTSDNMNLLSVGQNNIHINDFNKGDCSPSNVLDNGQHVGGSSHEDQITLMVNIDDTSCFGYHETGSSTQHNNKAALVGWETIHTWAQTNYPGYDGCLDDKWDRSYLGFDLALKEGAQAYDTNADGTINYATYNQAAESPQYAWDGEKIIQITTGETETVQVGNEWSTWTETRPVYKDGYKSIMGCGWLTTNKNFYVAADQVIMSQTISMNSAQASTLVNNIQNAPVLKDVKVGDTYYQSVINLPRIKQLVDDGYLPVKDKNLTEWVKVGTSDGYYSDWIVTLTEAKKKGSDYDLKIIAEDLSAQGNSDFDFNDVVLEVKYATSTSPTKVRLTHAGGTLPLIISLDGSTNETFEVHDIFDVQRNEMVNTGAGPTRTPVVLTELEGFNVSIANAAEANSKLRLFVFKENAWHEMTAPRGEPACKLAVGMDYGVLRERVSIKGTYELFVDWATSANFTSKWWTTNNQ